MKTHITVSFLFVLMVCLLIPPSAFSAGEIGKTKKPAIHILPAPPEGYNAGSDFRVMTDFTSLNGSLAYAENLWSLKLYTIDVGNPAAITIIGPANYKAFCSDFLPGDTMNMWIINYLNNSLQKVNISTGQGTLISMFPCPIAGGVWSCLSIHKSTGDFYAVATDGAQSILYRFEPYSGTLLSSTNLNIQAVISSTFDYSGELYFFDIASDSIYTVDVVTGAVAAIGSAGFNGDYAQGMGYDPVGDEIYLAAYAAPGGPQLRKLNRATGNTTYLANLPGSTGAFSFPVEFYAPYACAGSDTVVYANQAWTLAGDSAAHYSSLFWTTGGDGYFGNSGGLHPTYHPGTGDIFNGTVQLCLTAMPLDPGMDSVADCMTLYISPVPSGLDFGDAPETEGFFSYPTTLAFNGAAHVINPGIFLGNYIDGEPDGQPDTTALGDDSGLNYPSFYDDEDGVTLPAIAVAGTTVTINVKASVNGYLDAWMDFNIDNSWLSPDEQIFSTEPISAGNNALTFPVPATAVPGQSCLRFRFHTENLPLSFDGLAGNGEVEDYAMRITESTIDGWDFGDAPQGDNTHFYPTLLTSNGARHHFTPGIYLGMLIDLEPDGQPGAASDGDDASLVYPTIGDDEDGVLLPDSVTPGSSVTIDVYASVGGFLDAWMDFNMNGSWDDPGEHIFVTEPIGGGMNQLTFSIPASVIPGQTYLRFRFRDYIAPLSFDGAALNGEVEDYRITIRDGMLPLMDFGDAPENPDQPFFTFPTTLAHNGAAHIINPAIFLGNSIDGEPDGQPTPLATGDDAILVFPLSIDDEDGVILPPSVSAGSAVAISITASVAGYLDGWLDFDQDGTWLSPADHVFTMEPLSPGNNILIFEVPATSIPGPSCFRFRFRDYALPLSFDGIAGNGEVEDYSITITESIATVSDFGDAPDGPYPSLLASNGARHRVDWGTFLGMTVDAEPDGIQSSLAKGDDFDNQDDEDGVVFPGSIICGSLATIEVVASVDGYLHGWVDFNKNGSWADAGEQVFINTWLTSGLNSLTFPVPLTSSTGYTFSRFRFGTQANLAFTGAAENGEVEDYRIEITAASTIDTICEGASVTLTPLINMGSPPFTFSWSSIPAGFVSSLQYPVVSPVEPTIYTVGITDSDGMVMLFSQQIFVAPCDYGDAPDAGNSYQYNTLSQNNGASHFLDPNIRLGSFIDAESDGIQSNFSNGDDLDGTPDDEDGITQNGSKLFCLMPGPNDIEVTVSVPGFLNAWIDTDFNQVWDVYSEHVFDNLPVTSGIYNLDVPLGTIPGYTFARFRFTQVPLSPALPSGLGGQGEVEDYRVRIDTTYEVLPVGVSITASANPVPNGTNVTFAATPENGGSMPVYQWVVNWSNVGTNNAAYSYTPSNGDEIFCILTSNAACASDSPVSSNTIIVTVNIPVTLTLQNIMVSNLQTECYDASDIITVAGGGTTFVVANGGSATLIAGRKISFLPGTVVQHGGFMNGHITLNNQYCSQQNLPMVMLNNGTDAPTVESETTFFRLYPNPTTDVFSLEINPGCKTTDLRIEIYGMRGDKLLSANLMGLPRYNFSLAGKPNGIYFIRVVNGKLASTGKIIKQ